MAWSISIDQIGGNNVLSTPGNYPVDFRDFTVSGIFDIPHFGRASVVITVLCECDDHSNYPFSRSFTPGPPWRWNIECRGLSGLSANVTVFIYDDRGTLQASSPTYAVINAPLLAK
jgi:hypothetical protein